MSAMVDIGRVGFKSYGWQPNSKAVKSSATRMGIKKFIKFVFKLFEIVGAALVLTAIYYLSLTHPIFFVKNFEINGNLKLSSHDIEEMVEGMLSGNIFIVDTSEAEKVLKSNPWVKSVSIGRSVPSTININIIERTPVAIAEINGKSFLINDSGIFLEEAVDEGNYLKLIVGSGSPGLDKKMEQTLLKEAFALEALFENDSLFNDRLVSVNVKNRERVVARTAGGIAVVFGRDRDSWQEKFLEYLIARKVLFEREDQVVEMDLSFEDQVVAKRVGISLN